MGIGDWGLGIGDWGLGIGPNPQSPIPNLSWVFSILFINLNNFIIKYKKMKLIFLLILIAEISNKNSDIENSHKNIFLSIYENLVLKYPKVDVKPEDFIYHLSINSENFKEAWFSVAITVVFGLLVYIIPIYLTEKEHIGPYPLWLHNFYCAADFMGIWVFLEAYEKYHYFLFALLSIGEATWVLMELFCLQRSIKYESDLYWKKDTPLNKKIMDILIQIYMFLFRP